MIKNILIGCGIYFIIVQISTGIVGLCSNNWEEYMILFCAPIVKVIELVCQGLTSIAGFIGAIRFKYSLPKWFIIHFLKDKYSICKFYVNYSQYDYDELRNTFALSKKVVQLYNQDKTKKPYWITVEEITSDSKIPIGKIKNEKIKNGDKWEKEGL